MGSASAPANPFSREQGAAGALASGAGRAGVARDAPAAPGAAGAEAPAGDLLLDRGVGAPATPGPVAAERGRERGRLARHRATDSGRHHPRRTRARHACAGGGVPAGCPQQGRLPPRHGGAPCVFTPLPWGPGGPGACWEGQAADSRWRRMNHHGPRLTASGRRGEGSRLQPCPLDSSDPPHRPQLRLLLLSSAPHQRFPGAPVTPLHRHGGPVPRCLLSAGYSPAVTTPAGRPLSPVAARCLTRLTPPSAHTPRWPPRWAAWDSPGPRCPAEQPPPGAGGRPTSLQLSVPTPC